MEQLDKKEQRKIYNKRYYDKKRKQVPMPEEDVIISKRRIKYYSDEKPKFIKNEQVKILKSDENNCDEYITRIYINPHNIDSESMSYATELFKSICY